MADCLLQVVVKRNTVSPQIHEFTMQGTEQLYLTYRPLFNHANGRQQVILRVGEMPSDAWEKYKAAVAKFPGSTYTLRTSSAIKMSEVLRACSCGERSFTADISGP